MRRNGFQSTRISRTRGALAYYFCPTLLLQEKRESLACRECRRRHDHCYRPGKSRRRAGSPDRSKNYALSIYEFRDFAAAGQRLDARAAALGSRIDQALIIRRQQLGEADSGIAQPRPKLHQRR